MLNDVDYIVNIKSTKNKIENAMKNLSYLIATSLFVWTIQSCGNPESKDTVEQAEEFNQREDTANFRTAPDLGIVVSENYDDSDFAVKAADGGLTEVQLGKIAQTNASSQAVKDFGQKMVTDHEKANKELMALAEKKGIALPPAPSEDKIKHIKEMNDTKGQEFDKMYMDMMVEDHESTVNLFETASERATDADIKAFATKTLPVLREHHAAAQSLQKTVENQSNNN